MKFLLLCFLLLPNFIKAQSSLYQVEVNNHRTGSFTQSVSYVDNTHTFSTLDFQILTLADTLQYFSESHTVESDAGYLKSIQWAQVFEDTLTLEVTFGPDTLVFGPEKIRRLSKDRLDSVGASICYPTYSPELNQIVEIKRELIRYVVENAEKLNLVKETIGNRSTWNKFDKNFNLIEATSPSPFGEIKLTRVEQFRQPQYFETSFFEPQRMLSNIRFPDPNQISLVKLKLEGVDSLAASELISHNQKITTQDSVSVLLIIANENEKCDVDTVQVLSSEILWRSEKTAALLDSLAADSLSLDEKLIALRSFALAQPQPILVYYQLLLDLGLPARLVSGYTYSQWFWTATNWVEVAIDGEWKPQHLSTKNTSNALRLVTYRGGIGEKPTHAYLAERPNIEHIQVQSFTLRGKKHGVSSQALPYYFEYPLYENEGLGIRFQLPEGFEISQDGIDIPSEEFLKIENEYHEKIGFRQIITGKKQRTIEQAKKQIFSYLGDPDIELRKDKKLDIWYGFNGRKGAIAIPQGKSYIFITVEHEDPEFTILVLTRKNLHLKY